MADTLTKEEKFIEEHQNDDPAKLLFQRDKWKDLDMEKMVQTIEGRKKIRKKLPSWYLELGLRYPDRLCTEQCSSEATALYKATIVHRLGAHRIADLTGGLGADCWAFSQVSEAVLHNEMKPYLSEAVRSNLTLLGATNLQYTQLEIGPNNIGTLLTEFQPDLVFMDPARRDAAGKKVFLIEDCQPDVLTLKGLIFQQCRFIFLKLSPMADIRMVAERLGNVREIHVVSADGECKELLVVMERTWDGPYTLHIKEDCSGHGSGAEFSVPQDLESKAVPRFFPHRESLSEAIGQIFFEPGKAITKAGLFNTIGEMFHLTKLGKSSHLYLTQQEGTNENSIDSEAQKELAAFGKCFRVLEVLESGNKNLKYLSKTYPQAEVTAKNLPISSDALRKKLRCTSGGSIHLFASKVDTLEGSGNYIFVTKRI